MNYRFFHCDTAEGLSFFLMTLGRWTVCLFLSALLSGCAKNLSERSLSKIPVGLTAKSTSPIAHVEQQGEESESNPRAVTVDEVPLVLNQENIIQMVYLKSAQVRADREEMNAAKNGLLEFQANLNRFEPFVELRNNLSDFPHRFGAFGNSVETVAGVKKETFEGGVLTMEGGGAYSRFTFDKLMSGHKEEESGGGALVRIRGEKPFFGSRRRQERIIAQAFQESTARKAQLLYLKNYRSYVDSALSYFNLSVYYSQLIKIYQRYVDDLNALAKHPQLKVSDIKRVQSVMGSAETTRNTYDARLREYTQILEAHIGIGPGEEYTIEMPEYRLSTIASNARNPAGLSRLIEKAGQNNPTFRVLNDAISDTELQRQQAIKGKYDVTAFLEGTLFPVGSESFDNRLDGWTVGGGLNVRLNDRHVMEATRLKAEAQIRQFKATIEAEEILLRQRILTMTHGILDNHNNRKKISEVVQQKSEEYQQRLKAYFDGGVNIDQLLDSRSELASQESGLASNQYNSADRESNLLSAIGNIYEIVGLTFDD